MRVAVIGGSSSIGGELLEVLAARGDSILATYCKTPVAAAPAVSPVRLDLRDEASIAGFAETARAYGKLDAAVLLAAVLPGKALADYPPALLHEVMEVNVTAQARLVQALLPGMAAGGQMILMSSISGTEGSFDPIYAASKAALIGLMKSLARWHGKEVRFNCLAPSLVEGSAMYLAMSAERRRHHLGRSPTGALLTMRDLARVIADLTAPHWRHLNGAVLALDGGSRP